MYAAYVQERQGHEVIYDSKGFIEFRVDGESCVLVNMFIGLPYRKNSGARRVWVRFIKEMRARGCKRIWTQVDLRTATAKASLKSVINAGFVVESENGNGLVFLMKNLGG